MERTHVQKVIHTEAFNEVCEALNKVYDAQQTYWNLCIPVVPWDYRTTCKKLMVQTPSMLESGANAETPIECKMPSPRIVAPVDMMAHGTLEEGIAQLNEAECFRPEEEIQ